MADDSVLTTSDVARLLGMSTATAQRWITECVPSWTTPGGHRRVRLGDVNHFLAAQTNTAAASARSGSTQSTAEALMTQQTPAAVETRRLAALAATRVEYAGREQVFDRLTRLASEITRSPIALVTVLTASRQWFKSRIGMDIEETPRSWAFCNYAIAQQSVFVVEDACRDERFRYNPLVTADPGIRFYAGVRVVDGGGWPLGALCVLDHEPRKLRNREARALIDLAAIASEEISRRTEWTSQTNCRGALTR